MDEDRGLAIFETNNENKEAMDAMESDIKYFLYRSKNKNSMIQFRVKSEDPIYVYFANSSQELRNNTYCIQIENNKITFLQFANLWDLWEKVVIEEKGISAVENDFNDFWVLVSATKKLHIGIWNKEAVKKTYAFYDIANLDSLNFIGFSSFTHASWEAMNGILSL